MDDLILECLVQIRGLAHTPARVEPWLREASLEAWRKRPAPERWAPVEVLAHLADTELQLGLHLRMMLTAEDPPLPELGPCTLIEPGAYLDWSPELAFARFASRRAETVELLQRCSADDLRRTGRHPERGRIVIADLVAIMIAHDTDHMGVLRERLGLAPTPVRGVPE